MAKNETSFKKGNKVAAKNPRIVVRKFKEMLKAANENDNILSFQDACAHIEWRDSKVNYWVSKLPVFATLKSDIQNAITRRINKKALEGDFNPTASIWRMKQLGEMDQQNIDHTTKGESIKPIQLDPKTAETISKKIDDNI